MNPVHVQLSLHGPFFFHHELLDNPSPTRGCRPLIRLFSSVRRQWRRSSTARRSPKPSETRSPAKSDPFPRITTRYNPKNLISHLNHSQFSIEFQAFRSHLMRSWSELDCQVPGLAVVIVGTRKDSQSYVSMKRKACAEVGIRSVDIDLPEDISEADLIEKVHQLNADADVHGSPLSPRFLHFFAS